MDYARLIGDAWSITWRHKFLWVLGLFSGASAGSCSGSDSNLNWTTQWPTGGTEDIEGFTGWVAENLILVIAVVVAAIFLGLLFQLISLVAQGGMAQATADFGRGRPSSLSSAIRAGLRLFWRYFGLWLLLIALTIVIALFFVAVIVVGALLIGAAGDTSRIVMIVLGVLIAMLALLTGIPLIILFGIVLAYAQRAIAVEDIGPIAALRAGVTVLRNNFGSSLLVWLINVGISIALGIVLVIVSLLVMLPLGALGFLLYMANGFGVLTIAYIVFAVLVAIAVFWPLSAISNTYFWAYWTLAYLRLTGRSEAVV